MTRLQPVRAYWRKAPVRPDAYEAVHAELEGAYRLDQVLREIDQALSDLTQEQVARVGRMWPEVL